MFCTQCGSEIRNGSAFCTACGARIQEVPVSPGVASGGVVRPAGAAQAAAVFARHKTKILAAAAVVLVLVIALCSGGGGYKKTLDNYAKAYEKRDAGILYSSVYAQYWIDYMNEGYYDGHAYDIFEDDIEEYDDYGGHFKVSYEIRDKRRATAEQLEDLEDNIYDWYAYYVYDRRDFAITDAYVLDVVFHYEGDNGSGSSYWPDGLLMIKVDGQWRMTRGAVNCSFYSNQ